MGFEPAIADWPSVAGIRDRGIELLNVLSIHFEGRVLLMMDCLHGFATSANLSLERHSRS